MFGTMFAVAACSILELVSAAPLNSEVFSGSLEARRAYTMFGGDGSTSNGWPSRGEWLPFGQAWNANLPVIRQSCGNLGWGDNNSNDEVNAIRDAIVQESSSSGVPKEFILAIIMQESKGCVRAPTTSWGHANPGLMQSAMGTGTCNPSRPISPCPASTIRQMINDGTSNPALGTTLVTALRDAGGDDSSRWYRAARIYNAGRITDNNLGIGPTPCYASDIANRLVSPFGDTTCNNAQIAGVRGGTAANNGNTQVPVNSGNGNPPKNIISGTSNTCKKYWTPVAGNNCGNAGVDIGTLRRLNPQLNGDCTNLWAGYAYCVAP